MGQLAGRAAVTWLDSVAKFGSEVDSVETVPITATNLFKGRQYPGEVILPAVRWYLRYPLAYENLAERKMVHCRRDGKRMCRVRPHCR
jgi:hypothetical protein